MSKYTSCIVSLIDLNNLMTLKGPKSRVMHDLHQLVADCAPKLKAHDEVCFWQDSVLLLALVDSTPASHRRAIKDVARLKAAIDAFQRCHAVSVKGKAFPAPSVCNTTSKPRTIYLAASSWAFSNCFTIETRLKKREADWYIDSRIITKTSMRTADYIDDVVLLPRNEPRKIHVFHGSFNESKL